MTRAFLHADPFVPRCQEALARLALERTSLRPILTTTLSPPATLGVAPWIGQALLAKLETVRTGGLYVDARLIVTGDLRGVLDQPGAVSDARSLRGARLLWVPGPGLSAPGGDRGYDAIAGEEVAGLSPLPEAWQPTPFLVRPAAHVIDATRREDRPWVSPFAPAGAAWFRSLRGALDQNAVTAAALSLDVREGTLRPSLLVQLDRGIEDARRLPAELLAQDASFPFAELSASAEQRALLTSPGFAARMRELRRSNRARAKGASALAPAQRPVARLLGLLRRPRGDGEAW